MKKILLFTLFALSVLTVRAQNPGVFKPSVKIVQDVAQTQKAELTMGSTGTFTLDITGTTPLFRLADFVGPKLIFVDADGDLTLISDGTTGQVLTTNGSGTYSFGDLPASVSFGTEGQVPYTNAAADDFDYADLLYSSTPAIFSVTDNQTDATAKVGGFASRHYTNLEEPLIGVFVNSQASENYVRIGGGYSSGNAATQIDFFTAANNTTTTGTQRGFFLSSGLFGITATTNQIRLGTTNTTTISSVAPAASRTYTIPDFGSNDTFVGVAATQTLTNKTLTSPVISGGTINNAVIGGTTAAAGSFTTGSFSGNVTFNSSATNPYLLTNRGNVILGIQAQTSGQQSTIETYTKDGDGTDDLGLILYAKGTQADITNRETAAIYYNSASTRFQLTSTAAGTGTVRPFHLYTGANTSQLILNTDATVRMSSLAGTGSDIVYADSDGDLTRSTVEISSVPAVSSGSWTPIFLPATGSFGSITYDALTTGSYYRIGDMVHVIGVLRTDAVTIGTASGNLSISGLPFSMTGNPSASIGRSVNFATENPRSGWGSATEITLMYREDASINGGSQFMQASNLDTGTDDNYIIFSMTYITTDP